MLSHDQIHALLCSLIAHELNTHKPSVFGSLQAAHLTPQTVLREEDLALDSLSLTRLAIAVASFFDLYRINRQEQLLTGKTLAQWTEEIWYSRQNGANGLHFKSSGTSGIAKSVHHPDAYLQQEAAAWAKSLGSFNLKRVVVACPVHHIYGCIWGVLLPQHLQIDRHFLSPQSLPSMLQPNDLLVTVPPVWDYIAPAIQHVPVNVLGINSTGPLNQATRQLISSGGGQLWEIYGSSETAGIAWRSVDSSDYNLLPHWSAGQAADCAIRMCPDGQSRSFDLPDEVEWLSERSLRLIKRKDLAIQIGGHNVSAQWVATQIEGIPNIRECAVRAHLEGADSFLKAYIVLENDNETMRHDMAFMIRMQLPAHAIPKHLSFGSTLPVNEMGKLIDWQLT